MDEECSLLESGKADELFGQSRQVASAPVLYCSSSITSSPKSTESTSLGGEKTVMLSSCQNNLSSGSCEKVALMVDSGKQKMLAHPAWATERTETNKTQTFKGKMGD